MITSDTEIRHTNKSANKLIGTDVLSSIFITEMFSYHLCLCVFMNVLYRLQSQNILSAYVEENWIYF